jgi:predicted ATPase
VAVVDRLFGRDEELRRTAALLDAAAAGEGGALVLLGDAGIGKTSLIDATAAPSPPSADAAAESAAQ